MFNEIYFIKHYFFRIIHVNNFILSHLRPTPAAEVVCLSQLITRTVYSILSDRISYLYTNDIRMFVSWPGNMHLLRDTTPSRIFSSEASMKSNQMKLNPAKQHELCDSEKIPLYSRKNLLKSATSPFDQQRLLETSAFSWIAINRYIHSSPGWRDHRALRQAQFIKGTLATDESSALF